MPQQHKVNKGEWSEVYVLLKIFNERKVAAAGSDLQPTNDTYTFLKVFKDKYDGTRYEYNLETDGTVQIIDPSGVIIKVLEVNDLGPKVARIFQAIKDTKLASFEIPEASSTMSDFLLTKVKAGSLEKSDILAEVSDKVGRGSHELGFSIKSHVGGAPTLINSSSHTNFVYKVTGFNGDIQAINEIEGASKVRNRLARIQAEGGQFEFKHITSTTFTSNLKYADMLFPNLLSEMLLGYYLNHGPKLVDLMKYVTLSGKFDINQEQLAYKTMDFLRSSALGMVPSKPWDTKLASYGGYIVVLSDGNIVCYHLFNDDDFKEYLISQTKFDTPSTTKYKFGRLYKDDGDLFIDLNLQIRFLK